MQTHAQKLDYERRCDGDVLGRCGTSMRGMGGKGVQNTSTTTHGGQPWGCMYVRHVAIYGSASGVFANAASRATTTAPLRNSISFRRLPRLVSTSGRAPTPLRGVARKTDAVGRWTPRKAGGTVAGRPLGNMRNRKRASTDWTTKRCAAPVPLMPFRTQTTVEASGRQRVRSMTAARLFWNVDGLYVLDPVFHVCNGTVDLP